MVVVARIVAVVAMMVAMMVAVVAVAVSVAVAKRCVAVTGVHRLQRLTRRASSGFWQSRGKGRTACRSSCPHSRRERVVVLATLSLHCEGGW
jgi:hypothetical protein